MENTELAPSLEAAIAFTVGVHSGQYRKGNELPYIVHPMAVLSMLGYWDIKCPITLKAGVGHDTWEESGHDKREKLTFSELERGFGRQEAFVIGELSFFPKAGPIAHHLQKQEYMKSFPTKSIQAFVIKLADRICNTLDFLATDPNYARKYWNKARDLIDLIQNRAEEIVKIYGLSTLAKIKYSVQRLEDDLMLFAPPVR